jgi:hypothetical protein
VCHVWIPSEMKERSELQPLVKQLLQQQQGGHDNSQLQQVRFQLLVQLQPAAAPKVAPPPPFPPPFSTLPQVVVLLCGVGGGGCAHVLTRLSRSILHPPPPTDAADT